MSATEAKIEGVETCAGEQVVIEHRRSGRISSFLNKSTYLEQFEEHTCETCQSTFKTKPDLAFHQQLEHEEKKPFICQICNSVVKIARSLDAGDVNG